VEVCACYLKRFPLPTLPCHGHECEMCRSGKEWALLYRPHHKIKTAPSKIWIQFVLHVWPGSTPPPRITSCKAWCIKHTFQARWICHMKMNVRFPRSDPHLLINPLLVAPSRPFILQSDWAEYQNVSLQSWAQNLQTLLSYKRGGLLCV
jgi:hypothetical protein